MRFGLALLLLALLGRLALPLLALLRLRARATDPTVLDADAGFPEGPVVKDGTLYYAQYGAHKVSPVGRHLEQGSLEQGWVRALGSDPDGRRLRDRLL